MTLPTCTRTEYDLIGDRSVSAEAYYCVHRLRAMEIRDQRISDIPGLIVTLVAIKEAA